ncbi:MAG: hypothetical protein L0Y68_03415 [Candidatus Dadabacteria bacterium]|nr:hypothetical protein [Candidatus Dadabacteria bacterium]
MKGRRWDSKTKTKIVLEGKINLFRMNGINKTVHTERVEVWHPSPRLS